MSSSRQVKCCESMSVERRILLVEDSEPLARTYERYLRFESYNVVYAADGAAALQRLENEQFDAVILDLRLPDMHGLGILRRIRATEGGPSVVVITADGQISTAVEAMRDGAFDFIVKPFNAERLIVTLRNAVDHRHLTEMVDTYRPGLRAAKLFWLYRLFTGDAAGLSGYRCRGVERCHGVCERRERQRQGIVRRGDS